MLQLGVSISFIVDEKLSIQSTLRDYFWWLIYKLDTLLYIMYSWYYVAIYTSVATREDELNSMCNSPAPLFYQHLQIALSNAMEKNMNYKASVSLPSVCL